MCNRDPNIKYYWRSIWIVCVAKILALEWEEYLEGAYFRLALKPKLWGNSWHISVDYQTHYDKVIKEKQRSWLQVPGALK